MLDKRRTDINTLYGVLLIQSKLSRSDICSDEIRDTVATQYHILLFTKNNKYRKKEATYVRTLHSIEPLPLTAHPLLQLDPSCS